MSHSSLNMVQESEQGTKPQTKTTFEVGFKTLISTHNEIGFRKHSANHLNHGDNIEKQ